MRANTSYSRNRHRVLNRTRRTRLTTRGGQVITGLTKRPMPPQCELCTRTHSKLGKPYKLNYHHWDLKVPSKGMWLCISCHIVAEAIDKPEFELLKVQYQDLKTSFDLQHITRTTS